jgi:hypothetical protein
MKKGIVLILGLYLVTQIRAGSINWQCGCGRLIIWKTGGDENE